MTVDSGLVAAFRPDTLTTSWKHGFLWIIQGYQSTIMLLLIKDLSLALNKCIWSFAALKEQCCKEFSIQQVEFPTQRLVPRYCPQTRRTLRGFN